MVAKINCLVFIYSGFQVSSGAFFLPVLLIFLVIFYFWLIGTFCPRALSSQLSYVIFLPYFCYRMPWKSCLVLCGVKQFFSSFHMLCQNSFLFYDAYFLLSFLKLPWFIQKSSRDFWRITISEAALGAETPRNSKGYICDLQGMNFSFKDV